MLARLLNNLVFDQSEIMKFLDRVSMRFLRQAFLRHNLLEEMVRERVASHLILAILVINILLSFRMKIREIL